MQTIESTYFNILNQYLSIIRREEVQLSPETLNSAKFYARGILIAKVFVEHATNQYVSNVEDVKQWFIANVSTDSLFPILINDADVKLIDVINNSYSVQFERCDIGEVYERLLNIETEGYVVAIQKNYRNNLGSYYTPKYFARTIVQDTVDLYINYICSTNNGI